ncbi:protein associated with UVRAG as autophagy enhancer [Microcaecilia unicolor]|uniref:Protein associated with UVRAG as autophagy enhancer n=1 Tax=Microcaecilia unicolor TaxID=1415580 RepID=A0A6P7XLZ5_9AMPH|nr:protein associated with UVRAG as autophagy enhancer [Microcaecilia unicolor]
MSILTEEFCRPAVIGHAGRRSSYPDSTATIKDLLISVLNTSNGFKSGIFGSPATSDVVPSAESDTERWEDSSDGDVNDCFDSDTDGTKSLGYVQDIRLTRNKASWDNTQNVPSESPPLGSLPHLSLNQNSVTSREKQSRLGTSPLLKCSGSMEKAWSGATCPSKISTPCKGLDTGVLKVSSLKGSALHFQLEQTVCAAGFKQLPATSAACIGKSNTASPTAEENSSSLPHSQSCPSVQQAAVNDLPTETISASHPSHDVFQPTVDLQKENAHFFVADMLISAIEKMKSSVLCPPVEHWRMDETSGSLYCLQTDPHTPCCPRPKTQSESAASTDSGYEGCAVLQLNCAVEPVSEQETFTHSCESDYDDEYVVIEMEDYEKTIAASANNNDRSSFTPGSNSAEVTAQKLYRTFRKQWLQIESENQWADGINSTEQKYLSKEDIPKGFESSLTLAEEIKFKSRMREDFEWAPPRFQILFTIHPSEKRDAIVAAQNFLCAGCGTQVEPKYTRRLRYCDYLGKYFCDCCHSYAESSIPARILTKWDFSKYYVCNFSKQLLDSIWHDPVFNVSSINKAIYTKVRDLDRIRELQEQLILIKKFLKTCRFAESVLKEFEAVPTHLTMELHLFSLDDLLKVKRGMLLPSLRDLLKSSTVHVESCELCQAKGFICEFCHSSDIIFPFQTVTCRRCAACKACFHKLCFKSEDCPRCQRIQARKKILQQLSPVL